ncbi:hypothetical protein [Nonomuraea sp. SYSU D8015]|uniref:hypothetical protein n=1 Tax=Nonomuraea sp. SYSU D8015 TaxID=2593644 RepID=UPI0016602ED7|nr:hypothetical protein [Nonomuraea sp. SYSU D8015]
MTGRKGVSSLKKYFDLKPGQKLAEFAEETRQLTDKDFEQIKSGIENGSLNY